MKIFKLLIVFLILSAVFLFSMNAYATPTPTPTSANIEVIDTNTKAEITNALLTEANKWGINLSDGMIYGTRDDLFATFAVVPNLETYHPTDFEGRPVLVGFGYIKATTVSDIPAGYYRIEVQKYPGINTGIATLSDQYRLHTYTLSSIITSGIPINIGPFSIEIHSNYILIDYHSENIVIIVKIGKNLTPTPTIRATSTPTPTPTRRPTPTPTRRGPFPT